MKRAILGIGLAAIGLAAVLGYAGNRREQTYRRLIEQGDTALAKGDSFAAVEAFTVAIALKPGSMLGYLRRGEAYRQYGELETALKDLRTASQLDPSATRPLEVLGDVEHALGRYDRASDRFERYLQIDDQSPRILYKLALVRYSAGNAAAAVEALRAAIKIDAGFAPAHYLMGLCLDSLKRPEQARRSLARAVQLAPALLDAREALADLHHRQGRHEERLAELEALQALDQGSASRQVAFGVAHAESGQHERAITILGRAAERFPAHPYAYVALGKVWLQVWQTRGDAIALQKAIEALERAAAAEGSSEALTLLGRALLVDGEAERAAAVLSEATAKTPLDHQAFLYLADASERTGNAPVALAALLDYRALEGDPSDGRRRARLYERIANLSLGVDASADAVEWLQRAADADPGSVDAAFLTRLATAQLRAGDAAGARATATKALERDPENRGARGILRRTQSPSPIPDLQSRIRIPNL